MCVRSVLGRCGAATRRREREQVGRQHLQHVQRLPSRVHGDNESFAGQVRQPQTCRF